MRHFVAQLGLGVLLSLLALTSGCGNGVTVAERTEGQIRYESSMKCDLSGLFARSGTTQDPQQQALASNLESEIRGTWVTVVIAPRPRRLAVWVEDPSVRLLSAGVRLVEKESLVASELKQPFFVELRDDGSVLSTQFGDSWSGSGRNFAMAMLSLLQFATPKEGLQKWRVQEDHYGIRYSTEYRVQSTTGERRTVGKVRLGDIVEQSLAAEGSGMTRHRNCRGTLTYVVQPKSVVESLSGSWKHDVVVQGASVGNEEVSISYTKLRSGVAAPSELKRLEASGKQYSAEEPPSRLTELVIGRDERRGQVLSILRDETKDTLLARLRKFAASGEIQTESELWLQGRLGLLVELERPVVKDLLSICATAKHRDATVSLVAGALMFEGSADSQKALLQLCEDPANTGIRDRLLLSLAFVKKPSQEVESYFLKLAHAEDANAKAKGMLSLGTLSWRLGNYDQARSLALVRFLSHSLAQSATADERAAVILALGNTRSNAILPRVLPFVGDDSATCRRAAARACSQVDAPESDRVIADRFFVESDASVMEELVSGLQVRMTEELQDKLSAVLTGDADARLKRYALRSLERASLSQRLELKLALLAAVDTDPNVRASAKALLRRTAPPTDSE